MMINSQLTSASLSQIENYLRERFLKPPRGIAARLVGEAPEYSYSVVAHQSHPLSDYFSRAQLLWAAVRAPYLDKVQLPSAESWGLFAVDNDRCLHLSWRAPYNFALLFESDGRELLDRPADLANLYCDAALSSKNTNFTVLESIEGLHDFASKQRGSVLDPRHSKEVEAQITEATIEGHQKKYRISFCALAQSFRIVKIYQVEVALEINQAVTHRLTLIDDRPFLRLAITRSSHS